MSAMLRGAIEEFESAAYLALVEAAQAFDPSRNVHFATYARHRIWGALKDVRRDLVYRGAARPGMPSPAFSRLGVDTENHGRVLGSEPDEPIGAELEKQEVLEHWLRKLPRSHAQAFRHIYVDGKTQEETAALVGCSKSALCRLHSQAMSWLQQSYAYERLAEAC
jgi:RNA polymerase sigma factor (sigma-70 family)